MEARSTADRNVGRGGSGACGAGDWVRARAGTARSSAASETVSRRHVTDLMPGSYSKDSAKFRMRLFSATWLLSSHEGTARTHEKWGNTYIVAGSRRSYFYIEPL